MKNVVQDLTSAGLDWDREKWRGSVASKFIRGGEKNAVKYADEIIVLSKGVQDYFKETYGRETHFIPNGVNRPQIREASLITDKFGLKKDSYILFLGRLVPEKGIRYLVEAFKNVKTDKKLVIAGGSSDTEYSDCTVDDIVEKYIEGTPEVGSVGVHVDDTNRPKKSTDVIKGSNNEDSTLTEGTLFYDRRHRNGLNFKKAKLPMILHW